MAKPSEPNDGERLVEEVFQGLNRLAWRAAFLDGWRRAVLCVAAGVLCGLSQPPIYALPGLVLGVGLLVWVLDGIDETLRGRLQSAIVGWFFSIGYFGVVLHWIWVIPVGAPTVLAAGPISAACLLAMLALGPALAVAAAHVFWTAGPERVLVLAVAWCLAEWITGSVMGFPWAAVGYAWAHNEAMLQVAAWTGIYGLSLVTVLMALAFVAGLPNPSLSLEITTARSNLFAATKWPAAALLATALLLFAGVARLTAAADVPSGTEVRLLAVGTDHCFGRPLKNANEGDAEPPSLLLVPGLRCEDRFLSENSDALMALSASLAPGQLVAVHSERRTKDDVFETLHIIDGDQRIRATYDKAHEMPLRDAGLFWFAPGTSRLAAGGQRTFAPGVVPEFGALIGVDGAFAGAVVDDTRRPQWLLQMADETWLGAGGPKQSLTHVRVRAVEEGLPVVRAAVGGYSAVIDGVGRITTLASPDDTAALTVSLPTARPTTVYGRYGDVSFLSLIFGTCLWAFFVAGRPAVRVRPA